MCIYIYIYHVYIYIYIMCIYIYIYHMYIYIHRYHVYIYIIYIYISKCEVCGCSKHYHTSNIFKPSFAADCSCRYPHGIGGIHHNPQLPIRLKPRYDFFGRRGGMASLTLSTEPTLETTEPCGSSRSKNAPQIRPMIAFPY